MSAVIADAGSKPAAIADATGRMRTDIQALRGLAVALVVLHHSGLVGAIKAGYLGVDIFFVVSGYLITGIVQRGLQANTFSFTEFYFRRAKRLLPAAYVVFAATALLSPFFLTQSEMLNFRWQLAGAATFTGNIALWLQMGYFEDAAWLKPLLHVWSLSIEEQYYLLLPLVLAVTPRRRWGIGACIVFAVSLALCLVLVGSKPSATFYLLPTRAWELALGSVGALALGGKRNRAFVLLFWPAILVVALLPFLPLGTPHPGLDSLVVCVATLVIILRQHPKLEGMLAVTPLTRLGDMSYSLYLVHWPVFAFAANVWVSSPPTMVRVGLLAVALLLSWLLYRYVEQPVRQTPILPSRKNVAVVVATTLTISTAGFAVAQLQPAKPGVDTSFARRANHGLGDCEYGATYQPRPACQNSAAPRILLWGDSFAMHLANGIAATTDNGLAQATKSVCGPFLHLSGFDDRGSYNRRWADDCLSFNRSVLRYLENAPSVDVVVLAGTFSQARRDASLLMSTTTAGPVEVAGRPDAAFQAVRATIDAVRALGKRVVVVAPPPTSTFDVGRCLELKASGRVIFGADNPSCGISSSHYRSVNSDVLAFLARMESAAQVAVVRFDELLCHADICSVELEGVPLYRDLAGHFSIDGGILVARRLHLGGRVMTEAR